MSNKPAPGTAGPDEKRSSGSVAVPKLKKRGMGGFIKDTRAELKKVNWPTKKETTRLCGVVITVCAMCVTILWLLSTGFGFVMDTVLK